MKNKSRNEQPINDSIHTEQPTTEAKAASVKRWHIVVFVKNANIPDGWEPDFDSEHMKQMFPGLVYACWSRERGEEGKAEHYHIYLHSNASFRWSKIKKAFRCSSIHCEPAVAGAEFNCDYIGHTGKHADKKCELILFGEWGEMPIWGRPKSEFSDKVNTFLESATDTDKEIGSVMIEHAELSIRYYGNMRKLLLDVRNIHIENKQLDTWQILLSIRTQLKELEDAAEAAKVDEDIRMQKLKVRLHELLRMKTAVDNSVLSILDAYRRIARQVEELKDENTEIKKLITRLSQKPQL